jgi:TonB family protein
MRIALVVKAASLTLISLTLVGEAALAQTHPDPRKLFLTRWRPPPGQHCNVDKRAVPSLATLFDTVELYRAIPSSVHGSVVFAFAPPDTGWRDDYGPRPDSMAIVETTMSDMLDSTIRIALLLTLRRPTTVPFLVRLDLKEPPVLHVASALLCPPAISTANDPGRYLPILRSVGGGPHRASLEFIVRPDGTTTHSRVSTSSGDSRFDQAALSIIPLISFNPGLIDRIPMPVLVRVPIEAR